MEEKKQFSEKKKTFLIRTRSSVFVVGYSLIILVFSLLANNNFWIHWVDNNYVNIVFAVLLLVATAVVNVFATKEFINCSYKSANKLVTWSLIILSLLASSLPYFILFPWLYEFVTTGNFETIKKIYYAVAFGLIGLMMLIYIVLSLAVKNNKTFNKVNGPITGALLPIAFLSINYVCLFKFFTSFLFVLCVSWFVDSSAYIGGTLCGKHKMCPKISPNKTWEGFIISIFLGVGFLMCLCGLYFLNTNIQVLLFGYRENILLSWSDSFQLKWWLTILGMSFGLALVNTFGDLFFSIIKRKNEIKDYSNLIPGHGGMLDRIDALVFVVVAYTAVCFIVSISQGSSFSYWIWK